MAATDIATHPIHLGLGATAEIEPAFTGEMAWYQGYGERHAADGTRATVTLGPGQYTINEPGTWHTADVDGEATAVFITAGLGTEHRPR